VDITLPPLRDRKKIFICYSGNLLLILRINIKCPLKLDENAIELLKFRWSGNIRQLRNVAEQISVLETNRDITTTTTILLTRARQQPSVSHY
jgi:transcriptional regulator with PAS, ATPase and Fis domain